MPLKKILLPGGSGLLGQFLAPYLAARGYYVTILSRNPTPQPHPNIRSLPWDAKSPGPWQAELENAAALINLTGHSVNCRYTKANREKIYNSRIFSTQLLGQAIARCKAPPPLWLNASTATIYKHSYTPQDEPTGTIAPTKEANDAFSLEVATAWEKTLADAPTPHTRKIPLRAAMVLASSRPGVYTILRKLTRLCLGGTIGPGTQFVSWIHEQDFCRAIEFLLATPTLAGPINLAAPTPIPMKTLMQTLRQTLHRPCGIPTPTPLLKLAAFFHRTEPELLLKSRCVLPTKLQQNNFTFQFPTIELAFEDLARASK